MCIRKNKYKENIKMHFLFLLWVGIISCEASYEIIKKHLYEKRGRNTKLDGPDGSEFIYHGNIDNPPGSWPWVVSLGAQDTRDGHHIHFCTGVIVSDNNIMTTVGCLDYLLDQILLVGRGDEIIDTDQIHAKAGDNKLKVTLDDQGIQVTQLQDFVIHPSYGIPNENNYHYHDIAILTMKTPFLFDKYVRPIELPAINDRGEVVLEENFVKELLIFSDWGKDSNGMSMSSRSMIINPAEDCQKSYSSFTFPGELLCGVEYPSLSKICNIDYGTPVIKHDQELNRYVLKGFFSMDVFNEESCEENNNPNLIVPISSESNIRFIYNQLYEMSFLIELDEGSGYEPEEEQTPTTFPEDANLLYENCGHNTLLEGKPNDPKSQLKKYPWQVSLGYVNPEDANEWMHLCGGSIVTRTKIITAAHCAQDFQEKINRSIIVSARAGDDKLQNIVDDDGLQIVESKSFSWHPQYKKGQRYFDVGVVELIEPLNMTEFVRPICLLNGAEAKRITKQNEVDLPLVTTGWGKNDFMQYGEDLKETLATVLTEEKCNQTYENSNQGSVPNLFSSDLLCASDPTGNAGTCKGDSGGPAVFLDQTKKRYYLRAIVSGSALGICGTEHFPNIYVRTTDPPILNWILEQIKQKPQKVIIEPKITNNPNLPNQYSCKSDSFPVSDISWTTRDDYGKKIKSKSNGSLLEINAKYETDDILIKCVATNFMGKASKLWPDDEIGDNIIKILQDNTTLGISIGAPLLIIFLFVIIVILFYFFCNDRFNKIKNELGSCCAQPCGNKKEEYVMVPIDTPSAPLEPPASTKINWKSETQKLAKVSHGGAGTWGINDKGEIFQRISNGKWKKVEGPKLMDISVGYKEIWGVDMSNQIYKFELINEHARTPWEPEGEDFIQVSVSPLNTNNPDVWACDKDYKILHRQSKGEWMPIKTAPKVKMVTVGEAGVWIISDDDDVYYREGTYGKIENNMGAPTQMVPSGWNKVPEDKKFMWLSCGEDIVWAINTKDELLYREGISENSNQKIGTKWVIGPVKGVDGNLKQIDVCGKSFWGVNVENRVYYSE